MANVSPGHKAPCVSPPLIGSHSSSWPMIGQSPPTPLSRGEPLKWPHVGQGQGMAPVTSPLYFQAGLTLHPADK